MKTIKVYSSKNAYIEYKDNGTDIFTENDKVLKSSTTKSLSSVSYFKNGKTVHSEETNLDDNSKMVIYNDHNTNDKTYIRHVYNLDHEGDLLNYERSLIKSQYTVITLNHYYETWSGTQKEYKDQDDGFYIIRRSSNGIIFQVYVETHQNQYGLREYETYDYNTKTKELTRYKKEYNDNKHYRIEFTVSTNQTIITKYINRESETFTFEGIFTDINVLAMFKFSQDNELLNSIPDEDILIHPRQYDLFGSKLCSQ